MVTLTKAEEKIMQILWDMEKAFIKDIQDHFRSPKPPYNPISTIVRVLVKKDIVSYKSYGGAYQYYPLISKKEYSKNQLGKLLNDYFGNSLKEVVHFFSEKKNLDTKEVEEVMQLLDEIKKTQTTKEKNGKQ